MSTEGKQWEKHILFLRSLPALQTSLNSGNLLFASSAVQMIALLRRWRPWVVCQIVQFLFTQHLKTNTLRMDWLDFGGQRSKSLWPNQTQCWPLLSKSYDSLQITCVKWKNNVVLTFFFFLYPKGQRSTFLFCSIVNTMSNVTMSHWKIFTEILCTVRGLYHHLSQCWVVLRNKMGRG